MKFISGLAEILENHAKRKTLYQLRLMTERQLIDCGYSPELISEGVKAWPWRQLPENIAPLRLDLSLNICNFSTKIEHIDTSPVQKIPAQKDAA